MLERARGREVLLVDDSNVALAQLRDTLGQLGVKMHIASDGLKALNMLKAWADTGVNMTDKLLMVFTDAEMPEMDGYWPDHRNPQRSATAWPLCGAAYVAVRQFQRLDGQEGRLRQLPLQVPAGQAR